MSRAADRALNAKGIELSIQHIDGRYITGQTIHCITCGLKETIPTGNIAGGRLPPDALERKFKLKGWECHRDKWTCPEHSKHKPASIRQSAKAAAEAVFTKSKQQPVPVMPRAFPVDVPTITKETTTMNASPPLKLADLGTATIDKMGPADYRRIFRAIDDHWDEPRGRYEGDYGDGKIATALDVPRAWVEHVRKEGFGQNGGNEEIDAVTAQLAEAAKQATQLYNEGMALAERADSLGKTISGLKATVERIKIATGQR